VQQLQLSTTEITFGMPAGGGLPPPAPLSGAVSGNPSAVFATAVITTNGIDSYLPLQISGSSVTMQILAKPAGTLQPGVYRDTITVSACPDAACSQQFAGSPITVNVTYTVGLDVAPVSLAAQAIEGAAPPPQSVALRYYAGNGASSTSVAYTSGTGWLTVPAGTTPGNLTASFAPRFAGNYAATLSITASAAGAIAQTRLLPITYTVQPLLQVPAVPDFTITSQQAAAGQTRSVPITSADAARNTAWVATIAPGAPWLQLTSASGTTGAASTLELSLVAVEVAKLRNGAYAAVVNIDPALADASTVAVPITLTVDRPSVVTVAPYVAPDDRSAEVIVRGARFNDLTITDVQFGSVSAVTFTVDGPTRLRATHPVLPAGRYPVTLVTTTGSVASTAELVIVAHQPYVDAGHVTTPVPFIPSLVEFDPERRACYFTSQVEFGSGRSLLAAAYAGATSWSTLAIEFPEFVDGVVLTADGRELLVATGQFIVHLDPATLVERRRTRLASTQRVGRIARIDDGTVAFASPSAHVLAYRPWTGAEATFATLAGTVGDLQGNRTGSKLLWVGGFLTSYRIIDSIDGSNAPLFTGVTQGYAVTSNRLGTRWAFTPLSNSAPTVITDAQGGELGSVSFAFGADWNVMSDDGRKLIIALREGGVPSYKVFDLSTLATGGQPVVVGTVPIPLPQLQASWALTNLYLTPHEDEIVSCAFEKTGAVAIP